MEQKKTSEPTMKHQQQQEKQRPNESTGWHFQGHIKIFDPDTKEVFIDKRNAIHYENMSVAMVNSLSNQGQGWIYQMTEHIINVPSEYTKWHTYLRSS